MMWHRAGRVGQAAGDDGVRGEHPRQVHQRAHPGHATGSLTSHSSRTLPSAPPAVHLGSQGVSLPVPHFPSCPFFHLAWLDERCGVTFGPPRPPALLFSQTNGATTNVLSICLLLKMSSGHKTSNSPPILRYWPFPATDPSPSSLDSVTADGKVLTRSQRLLFHRQIAKANPPLPPERPWEWGTLTRKPCPDPHKEIQCRLCICMREPIAVDPASRRCPG